MSRRLLGRLGKLCQAGLEESRSNRLHSCIQATSSESTMAQLLGCFGRDWVVKYSSKVFCKINNLNLNLNLVMIVTSQILERLVCTEVVAAADEEPVVQYGHAGGVAAGQVGQGVVGAGVLGPGQHRHLQQHSQHILQREEHLGRVDPAVRGVAPEPERHHLPGRPLVHADEAAHVVHTLAKLGVHTEVAQVERLSQLGHCLHVNLRGPLV